MEHVTPTVTVCMVAFNTLEAVQLAWESILHHHPEERPLFFAMDNGSTDGTQEYLRKHADLLILGNNDQPHGRSMEFLASRTRTPYVVVMDSDVEVLAPVFPELKAKIDAGTYFVGPTDMGPGIVYDFENHYGERCRTAPWHAWDLAMVDGVRFRQVLRHFPLSVAIIQHGSQRCGVEETPFTNSGLYDTGQMHYAMARAVGWTVEKSAWLRERITHFGALTGLLVNGHPRAEELRIHIGKRLGKLRVEAGMPPEPEKGALVVAPVFREDWERDFEAMGPIPPCLLPDDHRCEGTPAWSESEGESGLKLVKEVIAPLLGGFTLELGGGSETAIPGAFNWDASLGRDMRDLRGLPKGWFDLIVASHSLEHILSRDAPYVLQEAMTLLKPGGSFFITCPHRCSELWSPCLTEAVKDWHFWAPSCSAVGNFLAYHGAEIVAYEAHDCARHLWWLHVRKPK